MKSTIITIALALMLILSFSGCEKRTAAMKQADEIHASKTTEIKQDFDKRETAVKAQTAAEKEAALAAEDARHAQAIADLQKSQVTVAK